MCENSSGDPEGDSEPSILIYDADCHLCEMARHWVTRWDRAQKIQFVHYEDPLVADLQPDLSDPDGLDAVRLIDPEHRSWKGAQAVVHVLRLLPFGRPVSWILSRPGVYPLAQKAYGWVARNRYRISGSVSNDP